jgi:signal transduction histidine kinase/phage shock protein PspC (stress-responsive transcriptional regulator)
MTLPDRPDAAVGERRVVRQPDRGWLGGVCLGMAEHLGVPVTALRVGFVVLASWRLTGVLAYFLVWLFMPRATEAHDAPGIDAATRTGLRTPDAGTSADAPGAVEPGPLLAIGIMGGGLTWLVQGFGWGLPGVAFLAGALAAGGLALVWWQADHASTRGLGPTGGLLWWLAPLVRHWSTVLALVVGLLALGVSVVLVALMLPLTDVARTLAALALSLVALAAIAAPWAFRVRRSLAMAREDKLISDARADMAAHLHDSVLQTLALIQRQSDDPRAVVRLARRQERELRSWLYGGELPDATLLAALTEAAEEIEDDFPVTVEVVAVGDAQLTLESAELVRAAREAMLNAAKHSGASRIDVYAEVTDSVVEVFVRDRGHGFDLDAVPADRMGLSRSIMERMQRHHGTARVRSDPETGTEVSLEMTR